MKIIKILIIIFACIIVGYYIYLNGQRNLTLIVDGVSVVPEEIVFHPESTIFSISNDGQVNFSFYDSKQKNFKCKSNKKEFGGNITPSINCIIRYEKGEVVSSEYIGIILPFYSSKHQFQFDKGLTKSLP